MHGVFAKRGAKFLPNCTSVRLCGVRGSHQITPRLYCTIILEGQNYTRSARHKLGQLAEKRAFAMYRIKPFGLSLCHVDQPHPTYLESAIDDSLQDDARLAPAHGVGFDNTKC